MDCSCFILLLNRMNILQNKWENNQVDTKSSTLNIFYITKFHFHAITLFHSYCLSDILSWEDWRVNLGYRVELMTFSSKIMKYLEYIAKIFFFNKLVLYVAFLHKDLIMFLIWNLLILITTPLRTRSIYCPQETKLNIWSICRYDKD